MLKIELDALKELDCSFAVNNAVVVSQAGIHHRCSNDRAVFVNDRRHHDLAHAQDRALRRVDDRLEEQSALRSRVGHSERAARKIVRRQLALTAALSVIFKLLCNADQIELFRMMHDRRHQAALG